MKIWFRVCTLLKSLTLVSIHSDYQCRRKTWFWDLLLYTILLYPTIFSYYILRKWPENTRERAVEERKSSNIFFSIHMVNCTFYRAALCERVYYSFIWTRFRALGKCTHGGCSCSVVKFWFLVVWKVPCTTTVKLQNKVPI